MGRFMNLLGAKLSDANAQVQEELYLAKIKVVEAQGIGEMKVSLGGKLGDWEFGRFHDSWLVSCAPGKGLPLEVSCAMMEKSYPLKGGKFPKTYEGVITIDNGGGPHSYDAQGRRLHYDPDGLIRRTMKEAPLVDLASHHFVKAEKEFAELTDQSLVEKYEIATQLGLNEFAEMIRGR